MKKSVLIILSICLGLFFACKKDDSVLGLDVQPQNDLLYGSYDESTPVIARTILDDSLISSLNNFGVYLLGSYTDPVFGRSDASIYTSFILKDNITNVNTGSKPVMDSVVLSLGYIADYYGDTADPLKVNVHMLHLGTSLSPDSFYKSSDSYHFDPTDITEGGNGYTFYPKPLDSIYVGGVKSAPQLRIRLDKTWFEENLLTQDNVNLANSAAMQNVFKGLYITTKNSTVYSPDYGSILYFSLYSNVTKITFYYHNFTTPAQMLEFTCSGGTAHFNHFDHDYGTANIDIPAQVNDTSTQDHNNVFIQSMAGLGLKINIPQLKHFCDSGAISVTRADLVLKVDEDPQWLSSTYKAPLALWMKAYKADGTTEQMWDAGAYWFGGSYDATKKQYVFNIARQVNKICNGQINNYGFLIYPAESCSKPYRVVFGGGNTNALNPNAYHMKLKISYTKLYKE